MIYDGDVTIVRFLRDCPYSIQDEGIVVSVCKPGYQNGLNAESDMESYISTFEKGEKGYIIKDFKIINQKSTEIANQVANYVTFYYCVPEQDYIGDGYDTYTTIAGFDYKGFIWQIGMNCNGKSFEETGPYFEHIIQTFKILD
jgi:hypothetical protein